MTRNAEAGSAWKMPPKLMQFLGGVCSVLVSQLRQRSSRHFVSIWFSCWTMQVP